jgi:uncharacterized protein
VKVIFDTNVLIAAFLTEGTSKDVMDTVLSRRECVISPYILEEFRRVLTSKKFELPKTLVESYVDYVCRYSKVEVEDPKIKVACPDANDKKILALCKTVGADFLITGDKVLLEQRSIGNTAIIQPGEFWRATSEPHDA